MNPDLNSGCDEQRRQNSMLAVQVGLAANILLAVLKAVIGVVAQSPALLADGINSTSDVAYGIVVSIFVRLSGKPADHEHPYGHEQFESVATVVVGAFVITTAIAIFWHSLNTVYELLTVRPDSAGASISALWVALFAVFLKCGLSVWTYGVSRQTGNTAVHALAQDHRNDIFASAAAASGIFFGRLGYPWIDPLAGAVVSLIILMTGIEILRSATADLMDTLPGKELAETMRMSLQQVSGIKVIEEIHAHRFGPYLVVNITIGIDGTQTVVQGHRIATEVEETLLTDIENLRRVYVHYHPVEDCRQAASFKVPPRPIRQ
ncbi:cation diffusion facilitator family transporter [Desulfobulbus oligotrophicus]|uniref:Cation transporter n=1 Tax=Desulfobulbus oligotrophicus TaxID=1909699 RepID=A0A7T5VBV1_9BACT|nr:cation diffusion facilitator family transporter [Desulfobulbus oligotrophicus]QQG65005.1 cation transporter [Desulfobulbus oligotrophicus]